MNQVNRTQLPEPAPVRNTSISHKNILLLLLFSFSLIVLTALITSFVLQSRQILYQQKVTPSPSNPSPTPIEMVSGDTYINKDFNFSLEIPSGLTLTCNGKYRCDISSNVRNKMQANFIVVKIIPDVNLNNNSAGDELKTANKLMNLKIGESLSTNNDDVMKKFFTYKRLTDQDIGGVKAMVFENKLPWESIPGTVQRSLYLHHNSDLLIIEAFTESDDISLSFFNQILSTFKFLEQNAPTIGTVHNQCLDLGGQPEDSQACSDIPPEARQCINDTDCISTCSKGCLNAYWLQKSGINDCTAMPSYNCKCSSGVCNKK